MSDSTDAALAANGDYAAFERLYHRYASRVYSLCARLSGDPANAESVMEDVFVAVWKMLPRFTGETPFAAWLHRAATEVVVDRRNGDAAAAIPVELPTGQLELAEALDRLPPDARKIFVLHDVEGFRHDEIAEILGLTVGGSKAQLRRARVLLLDALGP